MIILSIGMGVYYQTLLVDKRKNRNIVIFEYDNTTMHLSARMKEWYEFLGIVDLDDTSDSDRLKLYIEVENDCRPVFIERFAVQIELLKNGELICLRNGNIYWADNLYSQKYPANLSDTLRNNNYPVVESYCDPYLYTIESEDKQLIGCDTVIIKPDIKFTLNDREYHVQRTDTLYRTVEKRFYLRAY